MNDFVRVLAPGQARNTSHAARGATERNCACTLKIAPYARETGKTLDIPPTRSVSQKSGAASHPSPN